MSTPTLVDRLQSPRAAMLANLALVVTGSVLSLSSVVDTVTGAIIVGFGVAGVAVSVLGQR